VCSSHIGSRALAQKVFRQGYYWPTVLQDCTSYVGRCQKCQEYAKTHHLPAEPITHISAPWPFVRWGIDIVGPLPTAIRQKKFLIVAVDYFTKWIEAEPTASITGKAVQKFLEISIISRFGIPRDLVSDNGKQFDSPEVREYCEMLHIRHHFTSVYHPQANGQVENANRTVLDGLKKRLEGAAGNWVDVLPSVLWAYRTTHRTATGETPFSLTYGTEAVVPVEIGEPSLRVEQYDDKTNDARLRTNLDLLDETREIAYIRAEAYRRRVEQYYNGRVRARSFKRGDMVLRKTQIPGHKLGPNWEGPYSVEEVIGHGAYKLKDANGKLLPRAWNVSNLRKFYQ
jgi:transposase InsO family protein